MSILGKLLAVVNVLAAVAFLYLGASDWAKRHAWTYSVYRHELALSGLPVDDKEIDPTDDDPHVEKISDKTLQALFQQAGGTPVKTQKAEVQRAQSELKGEIDGLPDENAKRQRLLARLLPLARTAGERAELTSRVTTKPLGELTSDVDTLFQVGGSPAADSLAGILMPRDEKAAIAHLLFSLYPGDESLPRLQIVLGLRALGDEVVRKAAALQAMSQQTYAQIVRERTTFEVAHRAETDRMRDLVDNLADRRHTLANQQAEKARHEELLASRQTEVKNILAATEKARAGHKTTLDAQREEEKQIFQSQQLYHRTKLDNEQLERDIRTLEKADGEGKKP